ncbi:peptide ABC transporter ATP-binding protein, partial [Staphylococcus pseudintermedius]|nr:peptide ABC transporter ATP-binding protein [Staphylococcus pseudintermedius]
MEIVDYSLKVKGKELINNCNLK